MPIYEYQCQACDQHIEALQKVSDPPLLDCPQCGKPALKKMVSAAAFRLKGGGWYETDFKTGNKKNLVGGGGDSAGSGDKAAASSPAESKSTDSKASDSKSGDSKSGDSKKSA